jgi:uncharacterized lipoprotein YddW (UPF0748 family)
MTKTTKFIFIFTLALYTCSCVQSKEKYPLGYGEPVRGVWLTNVASDALYSQENIKNAVLKCKNLGLNTIFVVTWNNGMTMYPSKVMESLTGEKIDPELDPSQLNRDPLQELIDEAHKNDIKVFAWFEFGFSSSYNDPDGKIKKLKPEWMSLMSNGEICSKNNFEWLNALDPEVQEFISSLVLEVVSNYDVDGIQGDDRLPAMPSTGGYNTKTINWYKQEHNGVTPSVNYKEEEWVNWRSKVLNNYLKELYKKVKEIKPDCIVSMAPSVYPWSKEEYLQDWPTWVNEGYVDMICPQIYRKDSLSYKNTLEANLRLVNNNKKHLFYPGVLIQVNNIQPSKELFSFMIDCNRINNLEGEVFFFYEGLDTFEKELKAYYTN